MFTYKNFVLVFILGIMPLQAFSQANENNLLLSGDFTLGQKYRILQYRANVRAEPTRDSDVIATLSLNDEIEILENVWNPEEINEVWGCWYKIQYGNLVGYTFGGNIARGSAVQKIGDNQISVHFRITNVTDGDPWPIEGWLYPYVNQRTGVFVYVNDERYYSNSLLYQYTLDWENDEIYPTLYAARWLDVEDDNGQILIKIYSYGRRGARYTTVYTVGEDGDVEFLEYDDDGNRYRMDEEGRTWAKWNEWWQTSTSWHRRSRIIDNKLIDGEIWIRYEKR